MQNFLNSLSVVSYTKNNNGNTANNGSQSAYSNQTNARMLTAIEYTSSFLQTNIPIFIIMLSFICAYIAVIIF